jgi:hypothetical protein
MKTSFLSVFVVASAVQVIQKVNSKGNFEKERIINLGETSLVIKAVTTLPQIK